jgi:benzoyl-CoA reductase/2-hydroxyglutaryl-CoA dehydratase subunit BcrC/BadD/HgdB
LTHTGITVKELVPRPDLLVSAGWLCDIAGETDALIEQTLGIPTVYMDGVIDWQNDEFPDIGRKQVDYAGAQLRKVKDKIQEVIGAELTDEILNAGNADMGKLLFNYQTLLQLVGKADPLPISMNNLDLAYAMFYTPLRDRSEADEAIMKLVMEVKALVDRGEGVLPKGAPKVYCLIRNYVDPSITAMIQDTGLNPCVMMADYLLPNCLQRIAESGRTDPCELMVEGVFRIGQLVVQGSGPADYIPRCCEDFNVDGCIVAYPFNCRLCSVIFALKQPLQERGLPTLIMEADEYDTRQYSAAAMRTRVEAFSEMLRAKKAALV